MRVELFSSALATIRKLPLKVKLLFLEFCWKSSYLKILFSYALNEKSNQKRPILGWLPLSSAHLESISFKCSQL